MQRIPEAELMTDAEQAQAYAEADFDAPHSMFIELFRQAFADAQIEGKVLDLGCGPADISRRFARAYPLCHIDGIDGSAAMLAYARKMAEKERLASRLSFIELTLPARQLPEIPGYDTVISNSLLHHMAQPAALWDTLRSTAKPGAAVFIMDLRRPASREEAEQLVQQYAAGEPEILRQDFFNSLLASYEVQEVEQQLTAARLHKKLVVQAVGDRHLSVSGRF
jgi:2-polyprenyl-3-methyl-5-hydroxy-6-metoxy-1,4-benzoquinol methylase